MAANDDSEVHQELRGDKALRSISDDEFGLRSAVLQLSEALAQRLHRDGYAIGIEGPWGCGKSSFVNFIAEQLQTIPGQNVLRFEPWLLGDRSVLVAAFFSQLADEIDRIEQTSTFGSSFTPWQRLRAKRKLSQSVRKYGEYVAALSGPVAGVSAVDPTGISPIVAIGLKASGKVSGFFGKPQSLEKLKSEVLGGLHELIKSNPKIRFNIIIDDVDRLAPGEAVELLRMVQKVADFPSVTYIMCFDAKILSKQVQRTLLLKDGRRYTEKIFQEIIHVPPQEPFALRRAFRSKLKKAFPSELAAASSDRESEYRLHLLFDVWCGELLKTPRDVARIFDSVMLGWPLLPRGSDFCDFVWLSLLKIKSHKLYDWIRDYLQNVGAYRDRGRAGDTQPRALAKALFAILGKYQWQDRAYLSGINSFLPGVASFTFQDDKQRVFDFSSGELEKFEAHSRLGSPSHWRQYFTFESPSYALKDADIASFRKACTTGGSSAATLLWELFERQHERRGHFVDLLLDRLIDLPSGSLSEKEVSGMLSGLSAKMDELARNAEGLEEHGTSILWQKSRLVLQKHRPPNFLKVASNGTAINWLSYILRDQGFAHNTSGKGRTYPESQWLSENELSQAIIIMTRRFETFGMKRIFELESPLDVLFCWVELGDRAIAKQYFAAATRNDSEFLKALNALRGWQHSSRTGISYPLRDETVEQFLDVGVAFHRLTTLATRRRTRKQATQLLGAWQRKDGGDDRATQPNETISDEFIFEDVVSKER